MVVLQGDVMDRRRRNPFSSARRYIPDPDPEHVTKTLLSTFVDANLWRWGAVSAPVRWAHELGDFRQRVGNLIWESSVFGIFESPASSSSSYQQNGGVGGTKTPSRRFKNIDAIPSGSRVMKPRWKTTARHPHGGVKKGHHYCKKGWLLVRVGDTNMCWKPPR